MRWVADSRLLQASNGKLYGLAGLDTNGVGVGKLFEYTPGATTLTIKVNFASALGTHPVGTLEEVSGKLYGFTTQGGTNNIGTIFEYDLSTGVCVKKFDFQSATSGNDPSEAMLQGI